MPLQTAAVLRQRFSVSSVVMWVLTIAVVYVLTENVAVVLGIFAAYLFTSGMDLLRDVPAVDERWVKSASGILAGAASTAWLWLELFPRGTVGEVWPPLLAIAACVWLLLDARADFVQDRHIARSGNADDLSSAEAMLVMQHARLVADELEAGPKTAAELAEACDLTVSRVEDVIDIAGQDATIYAVDSNADEPRYALDERKMGLSGFGRTAASGLTGLLNRLARPFVEGF
ncbi:hypothetical protein [Halovenus sp. HT40]|uniref:hypothetical protein n=1 Tax=Halovenus sp. HT40 TaxID=3126691 RepID=UPI00300E789A